MSDDASEKPANPRDGRIRFLCRAIYECDYEQALKVETYKKGRVRLLALDTDRPGKPFQPKVNGEPARCLVCETRKYRKATSALSEPPKEPFSGRFVVMCSGAVERASEGLR